MTTLRLAIACVACCATPARAEPFPYTAYVNAPDVYLRSGPGEGYYPVAKLDRGQQVEVYRHDPGGWYAIRPPEGCFSWVSAEFIEPRRGNIGVVTGERVVARVGSAFSDTRDVIQVHLDPGEEVEILEAREFNSGPAARTWYKISPPAGEFRWISGRYLDQQVAEPKRRDPLPENNLLIARQKRQSERAAAERLENEGPRHGRNLGEVDAADRDLPADWQEDEEEWDDRPVRLAAHDTPPRGRSRSPRNAEPGESRGDGDDMDIEDEAPRQKRRPPAYHKSSVNLKEGAADLDLALSAMVAEDPAEWEFASLRRRTEAALDRAETALDRGRIRRVLRKIDNFAEIQQRRLAVMDLSGSVDRLNRNLAADARPPLPSLAGGLSPLRYDGVGRLTQLSSADPRLPQFALVDSAGKVAAYVSPAPGVNLRRYLNQEVGINGALGYLPERHAQHLTAKRIVPFAGR